MEEPDLPSEIVAAKPRFRALCALYRKRYELARDAILELQRVLGADAFLLLKGADYCHRLYARPELRPMVDVDILIPAGQFPRTIERLAAAGYPRKYSDFGAGFAPGHHEVSIEVGSVHVEPHRSFAQRVRAGIDYDGMWRRREWFESEGIGGYRLSPADAILGHAFNLAVDEFSSQLIRYVDFLLLLQRHESELRECVARAKAWQIERALFGALYLISNLFPAAATPMVKQAIDLAAGRADTALPGRSRAAGSGEGAEWPCHRSSRAALAQVLADGSALAEAGTVCLYRLRDRRRLRHRMADSPQWPLYSAPSHAKLAMRGRAPSGSFHAHGSAQTIWPRTSGSRTSSQPN